MMLSAAPPASPFATFPARIVAIPCALGEEEYDDVVYLLA
jgi:hypothetical protein